MTSASAFNVRAYVRSPIDLRPADQELSALGDLDAPTRASLTHLWSSESALLDLLRDLLVTPTHAEARVTAFLTTWAYEQYWIGQTIWAVVAGPDGEAPAGGAGPDGHVDGAAQEAPHSRLGQIRRHWDERVRPTMDAFRTNLLGTDVVAAHMTTGWLHTAVMDLAYRRIGELEPRLRGMLAAVRDIKARHLEFFADEARARLSASEGARRLTRRAVRQWQWPGVRYSGTGAVRPAVVYVLADPVARPAVQAIDADIAALPGLLGAAPVRRALAQIAG